MKRFNSSLVRLGAIGRALITGAHLSVSIPAWCDWEIKSPTNDLFLPLFQFQLGAIGSPGLSPRSPYPKPVSIPAWCDWEGNLTIQKTGAGAVSIPAWCDWEGISGKASSW